MATPKTTPTDVYCLGCGYNLRGQTGDLRRCPECGVLNQLADLLLPAELINEQLRRLETWPGLCVAAVSALVFWLLPSLWAMFYGIVPPPPRWIWVFVIAMVALTVVAWGIGVVKYRGTCRGQPGWIWTLFLFHFWGVCTAFLAFAAVGSMMISWGSYGLPTPRVLWWPSVPDELWSLLITAIGVGAFAFGAPYAYRQAKAAVAPLQRRIATQLARQAGEAKGCSQTNPLPT